MEPSKKLKSCVASKPIWQGLLLPLFCLCCWFFLFTPFLSFFLFCFIVIICDHLIANESKSAYDGASCSIEGEKQELSNIFMWDFFFFFSFQKRVFVLQCTILFSNKHHNPSNFTPPLQFNYPQALNIFLTKKLLCSSSSLTKNKLKVKGTKLFFFFRVFK